MRYQSKHSIVRMVRTLSVRMRVTILACALAVAGTGTAFAAAGASASTAAVTGGSASAPIVGCVNIKARSYHYVPWRGLWRVYTNTPNEILNCPQGSFPAAFASEPQLNSLSKLVGENSTAIAGNQTKIENNKYNIGQNGTEIANNRTAISKNTVALSTLGKSRQAVLVKTPLVVNTGGSFATRATLLDVTPVLLPQGTYLVNFSAKATPKENTSGDVFPQFFVYNQKANSNFTGDEYNIGAGALQNPNSTQLSNNDVIDSYYSGTTVLTVPAGGWNLYLYAFGYDSDSGSGSYYLDSARISIVQLAG